jgi:DNA-directed RNA polymerase subunit L
MEIDIVEHDDTKLVFHLNGTGHTFCNALKDQLVQYDDVDIATYTIKHPLAAEPKFFLETNGASPTDLLEDAAADLQETNEDFVDQYADLSVEA